MENYFTDSLLYNEEEENEEEPIFHVNDGNEADSEYEPVVSNENPLVIYLDETPYTHDTVYDDDEWVINENVSFEYPVCTENVNNFLSTYTLHVPSLTPMNMCIIIEDGKDTVFIVPTVTPQDFQNQS